MKKRSLIRIVCFALALVAFVTYFAFSTFLFSPLEGDYGPDVATLIPRDVDFYTAKAGLEDDFSAFPRPDLLDILESSPSGRALLNIGLDAEQIVALKVGEGVAQLEEALAGLPVEVDLLEVAGGRDAALAGYLEQGDQVLWAAYVRVNWMGKLGIELLPHLDLSAQGISVAADGELLTLSGGQLEVPMHLLRIRDVLVVGNSRDLVARAVELESARGEDSMFLSARYDHIRKVDGFEGDELEVYIDVREVLESKGESGAWPTADGETLWGRLVAQFFQLGSLTEVTGAIDFEGGGPRLQLTAGIATDGLDVAQKRLYRETGFDCSAPQAGTSGRKLLSAEEIAQLAPADSYLFALVYADVADVLRAVRSSLEEPDRDLLDDRVRQVWGYADALPLIDTLAAAVKDRFLLIVTDNDYVDPNPENAPAHDGQPVFSWTLVFWTESAEKIEALQEKIINNQGAFGIRGRNPGQNGVYQNQVMGGYKVLEYHQPMIAGTGHLSTVIESDYFMIGNSHLMLGEMLQTKRGDERYPSLRDQPGFYTLLQNGLDNANILLWLNPRAASSQARAIERNRAEMEIFIDWERERVRIEGLVAKQHYPEHRAAIERGEIPPQIEEEFRAHYEREANAFQEEYVDQHSDALYGKKEQRILASELLAGLLVEVALDPKRWKFYAKALVDTDG